jgi:hypothetical protein
MSQQVHVLFHTVRIFRSQIHMLIACSESYVSKPRLNPNYQNLRSQSHVLIHTIRILGLKLPCPNVGHKPLKFQNPCPNPRCQKPQISKHNVLLLTVRLSGLKTHVSKDSGLKRVLLLVYRGSDKGMNETKY